jgi:hypothetical protein
MLIGCGL